MEIRKLTRKDLDACWQCRLRSLEFAGDAFGSSLAEAKESGPVRLTRIFENDSADEIVFGATDGNVVSGMIILNRETGEKKRHKATITSMYVDANQRGKGIAGKLLDLAIDHAKNILKAKAIYLTVISDNDAAIGLYKSRGFVCWGQDPSALKFDGGYSIEDHMILTLIN